MFKEKNKLHNEINTTTQSSFYICSYLCTSFKTQNYHISIFKRTIYCKSRLNHNDESSNIWGHIQNQGMHIINDGTDFHPYYPLRVVH